MICKSCDAEFDLRSPEKRRAGGLATQCPDCSEETEVRHLGVGDGVGKQTAIQILAFESETDRSKFTRYWHAATGMHNGKACHMAYLPSPIHHTFKKVGESGGNDNHKGKL